MANPNPSPATRFKPGNPGGPGRPRGRLLVDELDDLIEEKQARKAIAAKWLSAILAGDFRYFAAYLDRRDGRVKDDPASGGDDDDDGKPKGITIPAHDPRYAAPEGRRKAPKRDRRRKPA